MGNPSLQKEATAFTCRAADRFLPLVKRTVEAVYQSDDTDEPVHSPVA